MATIMLPGLVLAMGVGWLGLKGRDPDRVPTLEEVSSRAISPYCAPLTLAECPSAKAAELRGKIAELIEAGWNNDRIDRWLTSNFGASIDGNPNDALAALLPAIGIAAGSIYIAYFLSRRATSRAVATGEAEPEELEKLVTELAEFRMASE